MNKKNVKRIAVITIGRGFGSVEHYITHLGSSHKDTKTSIHEWAACHIPKDKEEKVKRIFRRAKIVGTLEFREMSWNNG